MNEFCKVGPVQYLGHTGSKNTFCSLIKYGIPYFTWKPSAKALLGLKSSSFCAFTKAHDIVHILYAFILFSHEQLICTAFMFDMTFNLLYKLLNKKGHTHTHDEGTLVEPGFERSNMDSGERVWPWMWARGMCCFFLWVGREERRGADQIVTH